MLRRRLEIVQRHIAEFLANFDGTPVRVISMCAGEARDLLGAVETVPRRDLVGRLVEINPELAARAQHRSEQLGLDGVDVLVGDAGHTRAYSGAVPADLVLVCGVFGNISDADVETTVRALPQLCAPGATVIWTRHRQQPDLTGNIRRWLEEVGFENVAFETVPDPERQGSVGVARFDSQPAPLGDRQLFRFI